MSGSGSASGDEEEEELAPLEPKTFGRSNRGRLIAKMLDAAPQPDQFWDEHGDKFAEEEGDAGFDVALDPDAKYVDKVDSDFDASESSAEQEEVDEERPTQRSSGAYKDPRAKAPPSAVSSISKAAVALKVDKAAARPKEKKPKKEIAKTDRVVRQSTQWRTQMTREEDRERQKEPRRKVQRRVYRQPTQQEYLAEAVKTERVNTASLHAIRQWEEEEKARRKVKGPVLSGPREVYHTKEARTVLTYKDCDEEGLPVYFASLRGRTGSGVRGNTVPNPVHFGLSFEPPQGSKRTGSSQPKIGMPIAPSFRGGARAVPTLAPADSAVDVTVSATSAAPVPPRTVSQQPPKKVRTSGGTTPSSASRKNGGGAASAERKRSRTPDAASQQLSTPTAAAVEPSPVPEATVSRSGRRIKRKVESDQYIVE